MKWLSASVTGLSGWKTRGRPNKAINLTKPAVGHRFYSISFAVSGVWLRSAIGERASQVIAKSLDSRR